MRRKSHTIGLMDHMGGGNLGDDTTQTAVMRAIKERWPDATILGFSMNPPDTEARHGIRAFPIRCMTWDDPGQDARGNAQENAGQAVVPRRDPMLRIARTVRKIAYEKPCVAAQEGAFLARSFRVMRTLDIFVISGGGQLLDSWGGPWAYPYTILKWVALAKLAGTKCYFVNVGAGPLARPLSRYFVRAALGLAEYVSFRDQDSRALARSIGFAGKADVFPDCVYGIDTTGFRTHKATDRNERIVGLSPMAYCDPRRYWNRNQASYDAFIARFVAFAAHLPSGFQPQLFSTDIWFDSQTLRRVDEELMATTGSDVTHMLPAGSIDSLDTLLTRMRAMDFVITCRFHGVIFAHLMNLPVIALSHHPKVATLMTDLGLAEYCLDIDHFTADQLMTVFTRMVANEADIKAGLAKKASHYGRALTRQFDLLFKPELAR